MFLAISLAVIAVILTLLYMFIPPSFTKISKVRTVSGKRVSDVAPIVPGKPIFGNNFDILALDIETAFKFFREKSAFYKRSYFLFGFHIPIYGIITAEEAEPVLTSPQFISKGLVYNLFEPFLGSGLLISTGQKWHTRRKLLTPAFHFNILKQFLDIFREESENFVKKIEELISKNDEVCLNDVIPAFTLNNVCETALGVKLDQTSEGDIYRENVDTIENFIMKRTFNPWMYIDITYKLFGEKHIFDKYLKQVHEFSSRLIKNRRKEFSNAEKSVGEGNLYSKKQRFAMLDTLLAAENRKDIDHQGICEEVDTFMFEGYDTTSVSLTFTILMLSLHQNIQEKVYEEMKTFVDGGSDIEIATINEMKYLDCFIKESLRMYPSVPIIARQTTEQFVLHDLILPENSQVIVHIYDIHRNPKYYPDPDKFDPDRFLPHNTVNRHPFAFIPFSAGPRNCIGQKFALLEMKSLLIYILLNYKIHPVTKLEDVHFEGGMLLRSRTPIKVKFVRRKDSSNTELTKKL